MPDEIRNVVVRNIPHDQQRYPTVGDWEFTPEHQNLVVSVSELPDWRESFLVAFHEQLEAAICTHRGIKQADVDAFDIAYEKARTEGDFSEPGDSLDAPYYDAHQIATQVELIAARALGVHWPSYNQHVEELP